MVDRRKTGEVLFFALTCAISDRQTFIDAYDNDETNPIVQDTMKDIAAFKKLQKMLFGTNRNNLDTAISAWDKSVNISKLRQFLESNSEFVVEG